MHEHIEMPDDIGAVLGQVVSFALGEFDAVRDGSGAATGAEDEQRSARARVCSLRGDEEIRSAISGGRADCLDQAIVHVTEGVAARSRETGVVLAGLADVLRRRFEFSGALDDLRQAVTVSRRLLDTLTTSAPYDRDGLNIACATVCDAYWASDAAVDELDRAVEVSEELAVAGQADVGPHRYLVTASGLVAARFARDGRLADLRRSVALLSDAVRAEVEDSDDRAIIRMNLAGELIELSVADSDPALVRRAREVYEEASREEAVDRHPYLRTRILVGLMEALSRPDDSPGSPSLDDLDEAVVIGEQVLSSTGEAGTEIDRARVALAGSLVALYLRVGGTRRLARAIALFDEAVDHTDAGSPNQVPYRCGRADAYMLRADQPDSPDHAAATAAFRAIWAPDVADGVFLDRVRSAVAWGEWALRRGDHQEACEALTHGYVEIHQMVGKQAGRVDKVAWIRLCRRIPTLLAHVLVRAGNLPAAVAVIDGGRALLLADALRAPGETP